MAKFFGLGGLIGLVYLCFIRTDLILPYVSLFSGHYPFPDALLPYGGLYRLAYYICVIFIIFCLLAVSPNKKIPLISTWGSRSIQPYLLHMLLFVYPIRFLDLGPRIHTLLGDGPLWQLICVAVSVPIAAICSVRLFSAPFRKIRDLCRTDPDHD